MKIKLDHDGDGEYEYDYELFDKQSPHLKKSLTTAFENGIRPMVGDMVYGYDEVYFIREVCLYDNFMCVWVSEKTENDKK